MIGNMPSGEDSNGTDKFSPYLRVRLAFERIGGLKERHELGRAVFLEVTTRDKSLPWGYIIKSEDITNVSNQISTLNLGEAAPSQHRPSVDGYLGNKPAIRGRSVPQYLDEAIPQTWLEFCREKHETEACGQPGQLIQSLRVIDCEARKVMPISDFDLEGFEYATLSYASGQSLNAHQDGDYGADGLPESLPPLVTDALTIVKSLGLRYLWVDRYCLPQNDTKARREQIEQMGEIFGTSAITIIVAAGESIEDGIPGVSIQRDDQLSLKTDKGLFTTTLLRPDIEVANSKWSSRAWTLQEGLLARRRLVFTSSQVYFQCRQLHCHESLCLPLSLAPGLKLGQIFPQHETGPPPGQLREHIKSFISRDLTRMEDRHDAFRGVLQRYARADIGVENLLGLPLLPPSDFRGERVVSRTDRLALGLGWITDRTIPFKGYTDPYSLADNGFPSWTWLAWRLRVGQKPQNHHFYFSLVEDMPPIAEGVSAVPRMEISIGFNDSSVLAWEVDDVLINKMIHRVSFLRIETYCFEILVHKAPGNEQEEGLVTLVDCNLDSCCKDAVETWFRSSSAAIPSDSTGQSEDNQDGPAPLPSGLYTATAILISGQNWSGEVGSSTVGTALVCARRDWSNEGPLVRIGALRIPFRGLEELDEENAIMKGVSKENRVSKDITLRRREVDIY